MSGGGQIVREATSPAWEILLNTVGVFGTDFVFAFWEHRWSEAGFNLV